MSRMRLGQSVRLHEHHSAAQTRPCACQQRRAAAPAAQFADEEEKGDKVSKFVVLKAPVLSTQTDRGIAGCCSAVRA